MFFFLLFQATTLVVYPKSDLPNGEEYISRSLNLDWSFGMCLTSDLTALHRLAWAYVTPVYLLLLIGLSYFLSHLNRLSNVFSSYSVIRMFYQFVLLSFSSLAITSFQLLKCVSLSPKENFEHVYGTNGHSRFAHDASLKCFADDHLPWATVATLVVGLVCIPLPIILPSLHRYPRFAPLHDVYASMYQDKFRWWASVDLVRRLLFAAVYTAEPDPHKQQIAFGIISASLLAIHAVVWPFRSWLCNCVETLFLFCLACIAMLTGPDVTWSRGLTIQILFFVPVSTLTLGWLLVQIFKTPRLKFPGMDKLKGDLQLSARSDEVTMNSLYGDSSTFGLREALLSDQSTFNTLSDQSTFNKVNQ